MFAHTVQKYIPCAVGSPARFFTWVTPLPTEFLRFDFLTFGLFLKYWNLNFFFRDFSRKSVYRTPTGFNMFLSLGFFVVVFRLGIILWWSWSIFREREGNAWEDLAWVIHDHVGGLLIGSMWGSISRMISTTTSIRINHQSDIIGHQQSDMNTKDGHVTNSCSSWSWEGDRSRASHCRRTKLKNNIKNIIISLMTKT